MKIGFIGLGHMGNPMARNVLKKGHELIVYDIVPELVAPLVKNGAKEAASLADMAQTVDAIMISVQTSEQVMHLCMDPEGIFMHAQPGLMVIDCSSIEIEVSQQLHQEAQKLRLAMLDAPVSGGVAGAEAATLTIMVGGEEDIYEKALPLLQCIGKKVIYAGVGGSGQIAKICNNLLLAISMIGTCEAFALAEKLGLSQKKFYEISANASGQCWSMTHYCPAPGILPDVPANHNYEPGFMAKMMLKDLRLAQHGAETAGAAIPLGAVAAELYELYVNQGSGEKDFSGIYEFIDKPN